MNNLTGKTLILWGAGHIGHMVMEILRNNNVPYEAVFDSNPQNDTIRGVKDIPLFDRANCVFVMCISRINVGEIEIFLKNNLVHAEICSYSVVLNQIAKDYYSKRGENWNIKSENELTRWLDSCWEEPKWHEEEVKGVRNSRTYTRLNKIERLENFCIKDGDVFMDIGCGAVLKYDKNINGALVDYIPVDPFAHVYREYHLKYDFEVHSNIRFAFGEFLTSFFREEFADFIIFDNSLDHTIDPVRCILEAYRVLKVGGVLSLKHCACEGMLGCGEELHQWDFVLINGEFHIGNKVNCINVSNLLSDYAEIEAYEEYWDGYHCDAIIVNIRKKSNLAHEVIEKYDQNVQQGIMFELLFNKLTELENKL